MLTHPETQSIYDEAVPKLPMAVTYLIGKPVLSSIKESSSAIRSVSASDIFSSPCGTGGSCIDTHRKLGSLRLYAKFLVEIPHSPSLREGT